MPEILINRTHHLSQRTLRHRVEELARELKRSLGADYHWEGDTLQFARKGAKGSVHVSRDAIDIEVRLSAALTPFTSRLEKTMNDYLDENLA
jgi:putative polyhydroxyalkanoate system protein